jgi:hypothetical protein
MSFAPKLATLPPAQRALWDELIQAPRRFGLWYALLQSGVNLSDALGAAMAVYGGRFNPLITLKALNYFQDGDLPELPEHVKQALRSASIVKQISQLRPLPGGLVPMERT